MMTKTTKFDPVDYLDTAEEIRDFLQEAWEDDDPATFSTALGHIVRYHGVADVAKIMGVSRTSLYKTISGKVEPKVGTVKRILKAVELRVHFA
jgi:probable addiction module antidote protein